jgi:hypothetical protein
MAFRIIYFLFGKNFLTVEDVLKLAVESGFCKRNSGKIPAPDFLLYFCLQSLEGTVSYNDLAAGIESQTGVNASRQAYHQRMGDECDAFFQRVLETVILSNHQTEDIQQLIEVNQFSRILVQDSTVVRLPLRLFEQFSGVKNAHTSVCNARIQGIYDLISQKFIFFSIDPYSKNDFSVTLDIPVEPGDLVLRDRGYFTIKAMEELKKRGADSIFRYKHKTAFFDMENDEEINLLKYLKENGSIDTMVLAQTKEKYKVRIIAAPVREEIANVRRMKAKKESKSKNPSKDYLELMSWNIFVITIGTPELTFETVLKIYGLRWRIENIFRTWKGNFNFDRIHNVSEQQLRVLIKARLIMIIFLFQHLFKPLSGKIKNISDTHLSMMKFMRYISKNLNVVPKISDIHNISNDSLNALIRFCTYDKRKRINFEQQMEQAILEINMIDFSLA